MRRTIRPLVQARPASRAQPLTADATPAQIQPLSSEEVSTRFVVHTATPAPKESYIPGRDAAFQCESSRQPRPVVFIAAGVFETRGGA
jgi:hypothetical protein